MFFVPCSPPFAGRPPPRRGADCNALVRVVVIIRCWSGSSRANAREGKERFMAAPGQSQLAVTLFTLRDFCTKPRRIARTLARVRKIGYRNVQISGGGLMAREPAELAKMMDDAGLTVIGSHIALAMMRDDFRGVVARLRAWKDRKSVV